MKLLKFLLLFISCVLCVRTKVKRGSDKVSLIGNTRSSNITPFFAPPRLEFSEALEEGKMIDAIMNFTQIVLSKHLKFFLAIILVTSLSEELSFEFLSIARIVFLLFAVFDSAISYARLSREDCWALAMTFEQRAFICGWKLDTLVFYLVCTIWPEIALGNWSYMLIADIISALIWERSLRMRINHK